MRYLLVALLLLIMHTLAIASVERHKDYKPKRLNVKQEILKVKVSVKPKTKTKEYKNVK